MQFANARQSLFLTVGSRPALHFFTLACAPQHGEVYFFTSASISKSTIGYHLSMVVNSFGASPQRTLDIYCSI